jgi:ferritin-like metal-binding protein YciE
MDEMTLHNLLVTKLKSLSYIEDKITAALPKMADAATDPDLKKGFEDHLKETQMQSRRLEQVFSLLGEAPAKIEAEGIDGIIADGEWVIQNVKGSEALDAALIAAASYVEHYEMAGYISAVEWAKLMGHEEAADLLKKNLGEEKSADEKMMGLAMAKINEEANPEGKME